LEGHTPLADSTNAVVDRAWELTTDRANSARRVLVENGVLKRQIRKIAGFADTQPMTGKDPTDEANRRVTVLLKIRTERP
jgi:chemotaxis protein MotB